jgi:hypothetical protein
MPRSLLLTLAVLGACAKGGGGTGDAQVDTPAPADAALDSNGCSVQPCSILPQCGCTGQNTCDLDSGDSMGTACRNITVPGTETSACSSKTECDRNFTCIGGAAYASCKKFCTSNADCGSPRGQCVLGFASTAGPDVPKFCSSNCDPTDATAASCPSTFKCTLYTAMSAGTNYKIADCSLAGTGTQGVDCTAGSQPYEAKCAKGFQCVKLTTESTYKCRKICATPGQAGGACGGSNQCIGYTEPHTIGSTTYGVCAP